MNRRDFFRRSAILAAGAIAADQLELLERLTYRRRFFPSHPFAGSWGIQQETYPMWHASHVETLQHGTVIEAAGGIVTVQWSGSKGLVRQDVTPVDIFSPYGQDQAFRHGQPIIIVRERHHFTHRPRST